MNGATDSPSFFSALFDFSFSSFVTTKIIKVLYALGIIGVTLWSLGLMFGGITRGGMAAVVGLFGGILAFFVGIIYIRVLLEFIMIVFRIAENTDVIAHGAQGGAPGGTAGIAPGGGHPTAPAGTGWGTQPVGPASGGATGDRGPGTPPPGGAAPGTGPTGSEGNS